MLVWNRRCGNGIAAGRRHDRNRTAQTGVFCCLVNWRV